MGRWSAAAGRWRSQHEAPSAAELIVLARGLERTELIPFVAPQVIDDSSLQALVAEMEAACDGRLLAVPRLLLASVAEARGDMTAYRAALEGVLSADPQNGEALADLADLYAVAGDAREADRLYRVAGLPPDSDEITFLRPFLQPPADGPARNRPCPCGSGKKYKLCHGRTAVHPLERRASWLWAKVRMFAQRSPQRTDVLTGAASSREPTPTARTRPGRPSATRWCSTSPSGTVACLKSSSP